MVPCRKLYMPTYLGVLSITRGKFIILGSKRQLLESERRPQRMGLGVAGCAAPPAAHPVTAHRLGGGDAAGPRLLLVLLQLRAIQPNDRRFAKTRRRSIWSTLICAPSDERLQQPVELIQRARWQLPFPRNKFMDLRHKFYGRRVVCGCSFFRT